VEHVIGVATKPSLSRNPDAAQPWQLFLNEILTGELGADRTDYLLRDAHHAGQRTGSFDYQKLVNAFTLVPRPPEGTPSDDVPEFTLGLDEGGWLVAEQMVVARYLMYVALYFHKTKRIYEMYLGDFMGKWLRSGCLPTNAVEYARLTDSAVWAAIAEAAHDTSAPGHEHARPFFDRSHLRMAREVVLADNYRLKRIGEEERRVPDRERFDKLKEYVSIKFGGGPLRFDAPDRSATDMFAPDTKILVLLDKRPRYLDDLSEIVRGMSSRIWRGRVYGPSRQKNDIAAACEEFLRQNPPLKGASDGSQPQH
jgi:HD superfamily phosphohydrolase